MTTKERIINAAVLLFNRNGINQVSVRQIASEINISHGNLAYHFKNKNEILLEIYSRMEMKMDNAVFPTGDHSLRHYHDLLNRISLFQKSYQFFYMDMLTIAREFPEVIKKYRETIAKRSNEYNDLIAHLMKKGLVKKEREAGFYTSLFHSIWVMSTFWLQQKSILGEEHPLIQSGSDIKHVWEILLPYLTKKGKIEYKTFIDKEISNNRPIQKLYLNHT